MLVGLSTAREELEAGGSSIISKVLALLTADLDRFAVWSRDIGCTAINTVQKQENGFKIGQLGNLGPN